MANVDRAMDEMRRQDRLNAAIVAWQNARNEIDEDRAERALLAALRPEATENAIDPAEPIHLTVESERRLASVANHLNGWCFNQSLSNDDVRQAMEEIKSLRARLRHAWCWARPDRGDER